MLGENIKKIRLNKKLGLNKTAEKAEISGSYLSDIENGKKENPTIATLTKIADALEAIRLFNKKIRKSNNRR